MFINKSPLIWDTYEIHLAYWYHCSLDLWGFFSTLFLFSCTLKEKLPQTFMQIGRMRGWMEDDFQNLTAKVWANLDNPIKRWFFKGLINFVYVAPSGGTLLISVMSQRYNCLMTLYTNFLQNFTFHENVSSLLYLGMLGLRWMCMHLWMNLIKRTIDIQEKLKIVKIYVQSQWRVVLLWYHIFWPSSIQRERHTLLCIITSLKWIIQICSNFYCWVCKIAFYSPNPHCCLGKLPL